LHKILIIVAALVLCAIHGRIRVFEQGLAVVAVVREKSDPDTDGSERDWIH
jgi:hypothetical protein